MQLVRLGAAEVTEVAEVLNCGGVVQAMKSRLIVETYKSEVNDITCVKGNFYVHYYWTYCSLKTTMNTAFMSTCMP